MHIAQVLDVSGAPFVITFAGTANLPSLKQQKTLRNGHFGLARSYPVAILTLIPHSRGRKDGHSGNQCCFAALKPANRGMRDSCKPGLVASRGGWDESF